MSSAAENMASTALVPLVNDEPWTSAFGSSFLSGPLSASSTSPGACVTFGNTPKRTVTLSSRGAGTPAPAEEDEADAGEEAGSDDAALEAVLLAPAVAGAGV